MSGFFGDAFNFDRFALSDLWKNLKKDPKRLILGVDPWSTKAWNFILNRDDKPLVDQMGGPYDGSVLSLGEKKNGERGGVYGRYEAQGGDASSGVRMHNIAHVIAAIFGAEGLAGIGGGGGAGASGGASSGTSAYDPYASGYQFPAGSAYNFGNAMPTAGGGTNPYQSRSMPQQQQETQQARRTRDYAMPGQDQSGIWNPPPDAPPMETPPTAVQDPYAKIKAALLKQQLEQAALGYDVPGSPYG